MKEYNYSKDYDALYEFICAGNEALCLVDYLQVIEHRDVCKCKREKPFQIFFVSRGHEYGGVYPWYAVNGFEKDLFIKECNSLNVEWIKPY